MKIAKLIVLILVLVTQVFLLWRIHARHKILEQLQKPVPLSSLTAPSDNWTLDFPLITGVGSLQFAAGVEPVCEILSGQTELRILGNHTWKDCARELRKAYQSTEEQILKERAAHRQGCLEPNANVETQGRI